MSVNIDEEKLKAILKKIVDLIDDVAWAIDGELSNHGNHSMTNARNKGVDIDEEIDKL